MSEAVSRAGWHAQHLRHGAPQKGESASANTRGERSRLLQEAMRSLDPALADRQATRNSSIVPEDTHLNRAYVNDGEGSLRELTPTEGVEPVLAYGDARIDAVKRKWHEKAFETTTIVSWVPKSLLDEVPDYYPVHDQTKKEIGRRSRWVMPQDPARRAEVDRWFTETHKHLTTDVLTGGHDAVHGVVWNFDESQPHVHWMADTLAPLQKDFSVGDGGMLLDREGNEVIKYGRLLSIGDAVELTEDLDGTRRVAHAPEIEAGEIGAIDHRGLLVDHDGMILLSEGRPVRASQALRVEAQQMWGQSSEVTETRVVDGVEKQVKITGATKASRYQERYREHLIEQGFDIEAEVNERGTSLNKKAYGASEAEKLAVENQGVELSAREQHLAAREAEAQQRQVFIAAEMARLDAEAERIETEKQDFEAVKSKALDDAHAEGYGAGMESAQTIVSNARTQAGTIKAGARNEGYDEGRRQGYDEGKQQAETEVAELRGKLVADHERLHALFESSDLSEVHRELNGYEMEYLASVTVKDGRRFDEVMREEAIKRHAKEVKAAKNNHESPPPYDQTLGERVDGRKESREGTFSQAGEIARKKRGQSQSKTWGLGD